MKDDLVALDAVRRPSYFFRGQAIHLLFLIAMVPAAWALAAPAAGDQQWLGLTDTTWFLICISVAIVHQTYVWVGWRGQLGWQVFTRIFGRNDFLVFCLIFFPLLLARPTLVFVVAWSDRGSLVLATWIALLCGGLLLVPALITGHSVVRYFGFARAAGADHFRNRYRRMPLVTNGVFRWIDNPMYVLAFFGLWSIALVMKSQLALVAAIFQHGYIWAHYLGTEKPDMALLYSQHENWPMT
jgi:hypothetical protein